MELEHSPEWEELSKLHLEGRTAAFFCYGDGGGDELDEDGRPRKLRGSHKQWFDPEQKPEDGRELYSPLVWQCRYSGIEVPDELWTYKLFGKGKKYSDNQAEDMNSESVYSDFDAWTDRFSRFVGAKGKVASRAAGARTATRPRPIAGPIGS